MTDQEFHEFIKKAIDTLGLKKVAHLFDIPYPSCDRWYIGTSFPDPIMRPIVVKIINQELKNDQ